MAQILAIVTMDRERIGGGAPIFIVENQEQQQKVSFSLEKILDATAHDLKNGTMILVKHS
ncbi:capping complex subunit for YIEGIA [Paenibacillus hexagrammi]|uniref:Uncharacterized protein n=1 Tax=Paenibacillus hexagrammi TaxID=2908839 RepID=A0ABY3SQ72_9BACL|nr:hypothetical protein [Paenibacillus sp. YPD9-1]UJF36202.1 hypothetical protein L0M14_14770 [Paenibacillus sp. YPD9-1]